MALKLKHVSPHVATKLYQPWTHDQALGNYACADTVGALGGDVDRNNTWHLLPVNVTVYCYKQRPMLRVINILDGQNMLTTWDTPPANHSSIPKPDRYWSKITLVSPGVQSASDATCQWTTLLIHAMSPETAPSHRPILSVLLRLHGYLQIIMM